MRSATARDSAVVRRRGVVVATAPGRIDVRWTESQCRGCVGCGGRCGLFTPDDAGAVRLASDEGALNPGEAVDVEVSASRLRRAASRAYGIAIVAIVLGAGFGHLVGARWGLANLGAFLGLLVGTFSAGRLTKHLDASPPLRVRACLESRSESPERQR